MKSHTCNVFMETTIPIAFIHLPERMQKSITKISLFFKKFCSGNCQTLVQLGLRKIFRLLLLRWRRSFRMVFLCDKASYIQLIQDSHLEGPVQTRQMYLFERQCFVLYKLDYFFFSYKNLTYIVKFGCSKQIIKQTEQIKG